jgi:ABC-2 type transport system permease protein
MSLRKGLKVTYAIWLREFLAFSREKARIFAMVGQPFFYLAILGRGITSGMTFTSTGSVTYSEFMYPGVIGLSMLFTSIFSAMSIIWDREFGFLKEVLVAPVPRWSVAIGKSFGGATVAMTQAVILIVIAPLAGIWPGPMMIVEILALSFLISFATTSLGVVIASRMSSMQGFQVVMNFLVLPLYFLSGAMFPMSKTPLWMRSLMAVDPLTYGVDGLRNVVFAHVSTTGGASAMPLAAIARQSGLLQHSLGVDVAVTLLAAVLLAMAGVWSFNKAQAA